MKKFVLFLSFLLIFSLSLFGCKKANPLLEHVVEVKSNVYFGSSENLSLTAHYGFTKEQDSIEQYALTFKLKSDADCRAEYTIKMDYDGKTLVKRFSQNPVSHSLVAVVEVENFSLQEFDVKILYSGETIDIKLCSILPKNTLDYTAVLSTLQKSQPSLISRYTDQNQNFSAKIRMRVIVKEQKSYWYVGFIDSDENLKALLVDGFSGEVLAIREIL
ncbi:MAG: hypothetical protein IJC07_02255 [Clostridia bacterium]|nr:hypothetical protein [Clostridia bacterium]